MASTSSYIPTRQADFSNWLASFSAQITATPSAFGLAAGDAVAIAALQTTWADAYALVTSKATRTPQAVADKTSVYATIVPQIRVYAQRVANNPGVSSANKIALGLSAHNSKPSPISPPNSAPSVVVQSASALAIVFRSRDESSSPSVKAKPAGVKALELHGVASATAITDPDAMPIASLATKSPFTLTFSSDDGGKQFYFAARWRTQTGGVSPWSPISSFTVPRAG